MGETRSQVNKAHKSRFSSKSSRNLHKTSATDRIATAKAERNVGKGARAARLQRNKMIRDQKRAAVLKEKRELGGSKSPPRIIVLFPLCAYVDLETLYENLLSLLSKHSPAGSSGTVASSEFGMRVSVLKAPHGDLLSCMEMVKVADLVVFAASARSSCDYIDSFGTQCLSLFRLLGLPTTAVFILDLPTELGQRNKIEKMCTSSLESEFRKETIYTKDGLHKFLRRFKDQTPKIPHWRTQRSYLTAHKVEAVYEENSDKCTLCLTGYLRARSLSVNQLVHVSGAGDFQLSKIEVLKDPFPLNSRKNQDLMDSDETNDVEVIRSLVPDPMNQEALVAENIPDPLAGEQTWPTEAEIAKADEDQKQKKIKKRKLPLGTSEYQAAWIVDDSDEEELGCDNEDDDGMVLDALQDVVSGEKGNEYLDFDRELELDDNDNDSVMMEDDSMSRENIQDELKKLKEAHAADEEYPDEVDTPLDVFARKRFAKYRGLKSFRTSSWDPKESLPQDYARIFEFHNFRKTQKHVFAKALELDHEIREDCIPVGSFARLHIMEVPSAVASKLCSAKTIPVTACGLLKHESKVSVLHFSVKKHETYDAPIKSKEELIFNVGFRQFVGRPLFSSEFINTNKNKMERFLHEGHFSVASIYAPISFPSLPTIVLKRVGEDVAVAAVGSLKAVDPDRIILKRVILTGYPQKVSKKKAYVKHMFYNPEDVKWFKPIELYTKRGIRGRIKEPVGTHGTMKCLLKDVPAQSDTVCMNLFKRVFPKRPNHYFPLLDL